MGEIINLPSAYEAEVRNALAAYGRDNGPENVARVLTAFLHGVEKREKLPCAVTEENGETTILTQPETSGANYLLVDLNRSFQNCMYRDTELFELLKIIIGYEEVTGIVLNPGSDQAFLISRELIRSIIEGAGSFLDQLQAESEEESEDGEEESLEDDEDPETVYEIFASLPMPSEQFAEVCEMAESLEVEEDGVGETLRLTFPDTTGEIRGIDLTPMDDDGYYIEVHTISEEDETPLLLCGWLEKQEAITLLHRICLQCAAVDDLDALEDFDVYEDNDSEEADLDEDMPGDAGEGEDPDGELKF